jgi:hypothetical protein
MKSIILWAVLFSTVGVCAQTQYFINWSLTTTSEEATLTIAPGDIVNWFWMDPEPHSVTSLPGSIETFDSGLQSVGNEPIIFSYTFTEVGENPYSCTMHPQMNGTIIVNTTAATPKFKSGGIIAYPNPVNDIFTLESPIGITQATLYDSTGKTLFKSTANATKLIIQMYGLNSGMYVLVAEVDGKSEKINVLKQ